MTTILAAGDDSAWRASAIRVLAADASTPAGLRTFEWPGSFASGSRIFMLDESHHPTGSLKHHTMRLVFRRLVTDGAIQSGHPVVLASAGNAAVAAAHWCRALALPCTVVVPPSTSAAKTELIQAERATVVPHAPPAAIYDEAERIARHVGGFYLDHFTHAPTAATDPDWPVAHDLVGALTTATGSPPTVLIAGLGSGATAAGLHAHRRRNRLAYRIVGVDAENSAYLPGWLYGVADYGTGMPTRIEGLGRPVLPGSFDPDSIDLIVQAPDAASIRGARELRALLGTPVGPSSGANLWAAIRCARRATRPESIATLLADSHAHYLGTCHSDPWCANKKLNPHDFTGYFTSGDRP